MKLTFHRATTDDAFDLAPKLRTADVDEIRALTGHTPVEALVSGVQFSSPGITALADNEIVCIFGACPTSHPIAGSVWLLGSPLIDQYAFRFLRESRRWITALHACYPLLYNVVDARNEVHIHWLRWLGATFLKRHDSYGVEGRPFLEFVHV